MLWSRRAWGQRVSVALLATGMADGRAQISTGALRKATARVVVAVDDKSAFPYLPLTIAERLGYFAAEGIAVEFKEFADEGAVLAALREGSVQVFSGNYAATLEQRAQGSYLTAFLLQAQAPQIAFGVSQRTLKGFRNVRDLRGRRVGITAIGSPGHRIARLALARAALTDQDVRYVPLVSPDAAMAAFRSGEIDAIAYSDPLITRLEQWGELRILVDTRTVRGSEELFGGPMPSSCLAARAAWLAAHPEECQAVANAMVRALKWLRTAGLSDLNKVVPESYFQGDRSLYFAAFERTREGWATDGLMPEAGPKTVAAMLAQFTNKPVMAPASLASTYTNQFALKGKARYKA